MKLFWIIFTFQTFVVSCNVEETQSVQNTIKITFGYDCKVRPRIGEIFFWKISSYQETERHIHYSEVSIRPTQFKLLEGIQGITQLQSNETYLILTKIGENHMVMFYWVGNHTLLDDKKKAAKYALQFHSLLKYYYKITFAEVIVFISREREALESELFQHIIISPGRILDQNLVLYYLETGSMLTYPNLYVIRGEDTTHIKNVPMSTLWLKNDTCLVLETNYYMHGGQKVYVHCGSMTSAGAYKRARHFSSILRLQYKQLLGKRSQVIIDRKDFSQLKSFIEILENRRYYKPNEIDNSNDHLKDAETFVKERDVKILLSKISSDCEAIIDESPHIILNGGTLKVDMIERPISSFSVMIEENHILNTDSVFGVIVRFGLPSLEKGVITMQHAEEYVHNIEFKESRPLRLHIDGAVFPTNTINTINFKIIFNDYPVMS